MNSSTIATIALKVIAALLSWIRSLSPKQRFVAYLLGLALVLILTIAVVTAWLFLPQIRGELKTVWLILGPIALLVVSGLASPNVHHPATTDDSNLDDAEVTALDLGGATKSDAAA